MHHTYKPVKYASSFRWNLYQSDLFRAAWALDYGAFEVHYGFLGKHRAELTGGIIYLSWPENTYEAQGRHHRCWNILILISPDLKETDEWVDGWTEGYLRQYKLVNTPYTVLYIVSCGGNPMQSCIFNVINYMCHFPTVMGHHMCFGRY